MPWPPAADAAWDELRDAAPLDVWYEAARAILRDQGLPAADPDLYPTGSDVVMRCGDVVVKLSAPRWAAEIAAEADLLGRVQGHLSVRTPDRLAHGALDGWPYVIMRRIEGVPLGGAWPDLDAGGRRHVAAQIGRLLAELGRIPVPEDQIPVWDTFLAAHRADAPVRLAGRRAKPTQRWLDQIAPFLAQTALSPRPLA